MDLVNDHYGCNDDNSMKTKLCQTMSKIDQIPVKKWCYYRKLINPYDFQSRKIASNRAFYKLWEILSIYPNLLHNNIEKENRTLSICEAPGSFIQAIHKLKGPIDMVAVSKPPLLYSDVVKYGKTIPIFSPTVTLSMKTCSFKYVDILDEESLRKFVKNYEHNKFNFITADGGIDENEKYNDKEQLHLDLILAEIKTILVTQEIKGNSVLKIFDMFSKKTVQLLFFLSNYYENISFCKPKTSRPTNSEKYLICETFLGVESNSLNINDILMLNKDSDLLSKVVPPDSFVSFVHSFNSYYVDLQISEIKKVLGFCKDHPELSTKLKKSFYAKKDKHFDEWKDINNFVDE